MRCFQNGQQIYVQEDDSCDDSTFHTVHSGTADSMDLKENKWGLSGITRAAQVKKKHVNFYILKMGHFNVSSYSTHGECI
ncbi:zinc finger E-box-binding homeobox 1-like X12 [Biomphalaria pfeifferi]|uniref:Zinc finger E-box-binding homeobox 1-like X12 n=1 Tax=Biomphalaria pfeifferi TaxID=112525 RepID=A0AAD8CC98_BIOPF|nr:zinc finger E-box-binding homeobox 1-like X12 [Biomphalaria pfeifferi]